MSENILHYEQLNTQAVIVACVKLHIYYYIKGGGRKKENAVEHIIENSKGSEVNGKKGN
jgi:hypothetical protein